MDGIERNHAMTSRVDSAPGKWPKTFPPLTVEQERIRDDFMRHWHEVLPRRYGVVERFSHGYVVDHAPPGFARTLEVGAGLGVQGDSGIVGRGSRHGRRACPCCFRSLSSR